MAVVNRSDGTAEVHLKLQAKRDPELEQKLGEWVATVIGEPLEYPDDIIQSLKSGIVLCKLVNKLQPGIIPKYNTRRIPLLEMENIGLYLKACWELGVPSEELFVTSDLYLSKCVPQVFQSLQSLARIAQILPTFQGPSLGPKIADKRETKWSNVIKKQPVTFITDIEENERRERLYAQERKQIEQEKSDKARDKEELIADLQRERSERMRLAEQLDSIKKDLIKEREKIKALEQQIWFEEEKNRSLAGLVKSSPATNTQDTTQREKEFENIIKNLQDQLSNERKQREEEKNLQTRVESQKDQHSKMKEQENFELRRQLADLQKELECLKDERHNTPRASQDSKTVPQAEDEEPGVVRANPKLLKSLKGSQLRFRVRSLAWSDPLKPRGLDDNMVEMLNSCTAKVLYSSSDVEFEHIVEMNKAFALDYGRRQFAFVLKQITHQVPSFCLSTYAFDMLLYILNRVLYEMDKAERKDFISLRVLKNATSQLYRDENGLFVFIKEFIKDFDIWKEIEFWEEYFVDQLSHKREQMERKESGGQPQESEYTALAASLLHEFSRDMLDWEVPSQTVKAFAGLIAQRNNLSHTELGVVSSIIRNFVHLPKRLPQPISKQTSLPQQRIKSIKLKKDTDPYKAS